MILIGVLSGFSDVEAKALVSRKVLGWTVDWGIRVHCDCAGKQLLKWWYYRWAGLLWSLYLDLFGRLQYCILSGWHAGLLLLEVIQALSSWRCRRPRGRRCQLWRSAEKIGIVRMSGAISYYMKRCVWILSRIQTFEIVAAGYMDNWNSFNCSYSGSGCAESRLWNEYKSRFLIYANLWNWLLLWLGVSRPGIYVSSVERNLWHWKDCQKMRWYCFWLIVDLEYFESWFMAAGFPC